MNKKLMVPVVIILLIVCGVLFFFFTNKTSESYSDKRIKLIVNAATMEVRLYDNATAEGFYNKLKEGHIIIEASDNGHDGKAGELGFNLSKNDESVTIQLGDIVYQDNKLAIYYGKNTSNVTKIGRIQDTNSSYLKNILGSGNVKLEFSI